MPSPLNLNGRTAIVTGAASGIGRAIAGALARRGCHLALADIDEDGLVGTAARVREHGVRASTHRLNVADRDAVAAFPDVVTDAHPGGVDVLVNNAGVSVSGKFEEVSAEDFEWLFEVNFWGVVRMSRAFLPLLKASDDAQIVNLSSLFGIIAPPGEVPYTSSKFAVRGFSMALLHELARTNVGVTVVHPGGVNTSIADNARAPADADPEDVEKYRKRIKARLTLDPAEAGETIVRGAEQRKVRVLVGTDAKAAATLERLAPVGHWAVIQRFM